MLSSVLVGSAGVVPLSFSTTSPGLTWPFAFSYVAHFLPPGGAGEQRRLTFVGCSDPPFVSTITLLPLFVVSNQSATTTFLGNDTAIDWRATSVTTFTSRQRTTPTETTHSLPSPFASQPGCVCSAVELNSAPVPSASSRTYVVH